MTLPEVSQDLTPDLTGIHVSDTVGLSWNCSMKSLTAGGTELCKWLLKISAGQSLHVSSFTTAHRLLGGDKTFEWNGASAVVHGAVWAACKEKADKEREQEEVEWRERDGEVTQINVSTQTSTSSRSSSSSSSFPDPHHLSAYPRERRLQTGGTGKTFPPQQRSIRLLDEDEECAAKTWYDCSRVLPPTVLNTDAWAVTLDVSTPSHETLRAFR
ncbi:hypothetical protein EYF80_040079 [Liparis tanakae]|uniref:Uncharacterized protein n=1 Tax=Liparis tanakae TaxID=230148 RepID=A0A4Z2G968_9TELE|nr:hypothetical protein EYF80_040079 [Liparis tanakae]